MATEFNMFFRLKAQSHNNSHKNIFQKYKEKQRPNKIQLLSGKN